MRILMTGGTGFLGHFVLSELRKFAEVDVISRNGENRFRGDLTSWNAGLDIESLRQNKYEALVHLSGLYDLKADRTSVLLQNVVGTSTALRLSQLLRIPVFLNASSIAAASNLGTKEVDPLDLSFTDSFHDAYSESKALVEEQLIHWTGPLISKINIRLGILVGDTKDGKILRVDGPYHTPDALKKVSGLIKQWNIPLPLPGSYEVRLPLVPVDVAANGLVQILRKTIEEKIKGYNSYHLVPAKGLSITKLYQSTFNFLGLGEKTIHLVGQLPVRATSELSKMTLGFPPEQLRYALKMPRYNATSTQHLIGSDWCPEFEEYELQFWSGYEKHISHR